MDDVVDLSMSIGGREAVSLSTATVRDLQALTQNAGLTITPAPPSAVSNGKSSATIYHNCLMCDCICGFFFSLSESGSVLIERVRRPHNKLCY